MPRWQKPDAPHPLLPLLIAAADGTFPRVDGQAVLAPELAGGLQAVVSFTGHAVIATDLTSADLGDLVLDGYGAALHPDVLHRLAGPGGDIGVIDVTLAIRGLGGGTLPLRADLDHHPRPTSCCPVTAPPGAGSLHSAVEMARKSAEY